MVELVLQNTFASADIFKKYSNALNVKNAYLKGFENGVHLTLVFKVQIMLDSKTWYNINIDMWYFATHLQIYNTYARD